jgi:hypothetical protein
VKARIEKPKMMLGQASGGAVRLGEAVAGLPLILCEGIETGLAGSRPPAARLPRPSRAEPYR